MTPRSPRAPNRLLLLDIGNTHCHVGLASPTRRLAHADLPTRDLAEPSRALGVLHRLTRGEPLAGAALCSVVPRATVEATALLRRHFRIRPLVLTHDTVRGLDLDYPRPGTIGPDRLANAIAARQSFGAPSLVVDFGTAVTFDIIDARGCYVGGIIAPGLSAMTDYLHEKTALLPRIRIRNITVAYGRSTEQAMLVGAVHGYRGLVRELIANVKRDLGAVRLPVVATGGYGRLIARGVPEFTAVRPHLTLDGLLLFWRHHHPDPPAGRR